MLDAKCETKAMRSAEVRSRLKMTRLKWDICHTVDPTKLLKCLVNTKWPSKFKGVLVRDSVHVKH